MPAQASLALAPGLVVSLIQETKADQAEGRLGTELVRIRELFERLPPGAMVILDELCSGTNPSEGEEIFELVVRMLTRLAPQAFITTHFLAFARGSSGSATSRTCASCRSSSVRSTSRRTSSRRASRTTSLAGHAAARLGVTRDQLIALIERNIAASRGS